MTKILDPLKSQCIIRMLDALLEHGEMDAREWAKVAYVSEPTIRAYTAQLRSCGLIHLVRVGLNHLGDNRNRIYAYGPGKNCKVVPMKHRTKKEREFIPVPKIPQPDFITAVFLKHSHNEQRTAHA